MASASSEYLQGVAIGVAKLLGTEFKYFRSRNEFRRAVPEGHDVVVLSSSNKWSPLINVSFYFGKNYSAAKRIETILGPHRSIYHVQQFAFHRQPLYAATYSGPDNWDIDLTHPPEDLPQQILAAIRGMAEPFFERFTSINAARDAIANEDRGCFSGQAFWRQLLLLDLTLGDIKHFLDWSASLPPFEAQQAKEQIAKYRQAHENAA